MTDDNRTKTVPSHYVGVFHKPTGVELDCLDLKEPTPEALDESMWSNKHSIAEELKAIHKELKDIKALIKAGKE